MTTEQQTSSLHTHTATIDGETITLGPGDWQARIDDLLRRHGGGVPKIERLAPDEILAAERAAETAAPPSDTTSRDVRTGEEIAATYEKPLFSTFGSGGQIVDERAESRIEAQQASLAADGVAIPAGAQLYATGTRMAEIGYRTQEDRAREHDRKLPASEAAEFLTKAVRDERREDVVLSAAEIARELRANGVVTVSGLRLGEQAIRGILARVESPALGYVLGLRDRAARSAARLRALDMAAADAENAAAALRAEKSADTAKIAEVLRHELAYAGSVSIRLRTRAGRGDVFAAVSPDYAPADAPEVLEQIAEKLPGDARATWAYDPASTAWELRASVWTPTPVEEQAVGEPFEGYASFASRDNGSSSLRGGGGISILACLNASTYVAGNSSAKRVHRGRILVDVGAMLGQALRSIDALCAAWGRAREEEIAIDALVGLPVSEQIPGIWWGELLDRRSVLAGVLPGRSARHVEGLSAAYASERRDPARVVRADLAQAWTRYVQNQPAPVRREAEAAVARWIVEPSPVRFDAERVAE